ncbi:MAG TPA: cytochrome c oxidase subunit II [Candidatus Binatia bacterium]|jgi:cytochrome c oxidase subunit 2|nr:cytochrome c oxidase subunit II [Candidatus Binatia bacterium]
MNGAPPMSMISFDSDLAAGITKLFLGITAVDVFILVLVSALAALAVLRYSKREGLGSEVSHERQLKLEIAWTVGPALIIAVIGTFAVRLSFQTQRPTVPTDALVVRVTAHQWWWDVRYPSLGVVTANEIHVPADRPVRIRLDSADVVHSFWVPRLAGKRDVVPGQTNDLTFVAHTVGTYPGECAEFCGTSHANMRFEVFVDPPDRFDAWAAAQAAPPRIAAPPAAPNDPVRAGARVFATSSCTPCHAVGSAARGVFGPNLTHFGSRTTFAGATVPNTPENLAAWLRNPPALKPGVKMPPLGVPEHQIAELVAYLRSLE